MTTAMDADDVAGIAGRREAMGAALYRRFWERNKWANPTPFDNQAEAIRGMWVSIGEDALAHLQEQNP